MIFKLTLRKTTEDFDKKWIVEVIVSCRIITEGVKNQEKSNGFLKLYNKNNKIIIIKITNTNRINRRVLGFI